MKSIILGAAAGHIAHGKTALVKALIGIDVDRLDEEKRRICSRTKDWLGHVDLFSARNAASHSS